MPVGAWADRQSGAGIGYLTRTARLVPRYDDGTLSPDEAGGYRRCVISGCQEAWPRPADMADSLWPADGKQHLHRRSEQVVWAEGKG